MAASQCWGSGSGFAPKNVKDPKHCFKLTVPVPAGSRTLPSLRTHLHSPCAEHCAGQPSSVQCRPFQPRTHRQVPFLHCPWSAQRGSHSRLWHCSPDQPAWNGTVTACTGRGARSAGHTPSSGTARPTSLHGIEQLLLALAVERAARVTLPALALLARPACMEQNSYCLHWPWSAQRGSNSRLWHCSPDQPAGNRTCIRCCLHFSDQLQITLKISKTQCPFVPKAST
jgi:hypothetical protein